MRMRSVVLLTGLATACALGASGVVVYCVQPPAPVAATCCDAESARARTGKAHCGCPASKASCAMPCAGCCNPMPCPPSPTGAGR